MNDARRNEVQRKVSDGNEERKNAGDNAELKIRTAAADDHNNWMLRVEVGEGAGIGTKDVSYSDQIPGVKLWAKRVVDDEKVKLSRAEKDKLQINREGRD